VALQRFVCDNATLNINVYNAYKIISLSIFQAAWFNYWLTKVCNKTFGDYWSVFL